MGRTSLRPWFMGNKMQFEAVACRLFLHYSYTLAQKASNYGIFCFYYNLDRDAMHTAVDDFEAQLPNYDIALYEFIKEIIDPAIILKLKKELEINLNEF